jgi:transcriptional regulator with XRE-family HTH domain
MVSERDIQMARKLKKLRRQHKIKQQVIFDLLNLKSQQQYSELESGQRVFNEDLVLTICEVFGISLLDFAGNERKSSFHFFCFDYDFKIIEQAKNSAHEALIYKIIYLETRLENIELKLNKLMPQYHLKTQVPIKNKCYVII